MVLGGEPWCCVRARSLRPAWFGFGRSRARSSSRPAAKARSRASRLRRPPAARRRARARRAARERRRRAHRGRGCGRAELAHARPHLLRAALQPARRQINESNVAELGPRVVLRPRHDSRRRGDAARRRRRAVHDERVEHRLRARREDRPRALGLRPEGAEALGPIRVLRRREPRRRGLETAASTSARSTAGSIALDAATGKLVWEKITVDQSLPYTITGAPRVVNGKVVIGNGGAEYGVRGYVTAYDAATGEQVWRFYTVPGDPAKGFESKALEMAADDLERRVVEGRRRRHAVGRARLRPRAQLALHRHRQRQPVVARHPQPRRRRQSVPRRRSSR